MRRTTNVVMAMAVLVAVVAAVWPDGDDGRPLGVSVPVQLVASLETFGDCEELEAYFEENAGPTPLMGVAPGSGGVEAVGDSVAAESTQAGGGAPAAAPDLVRETAASDDFSRTNIQESGVDEPDLVKTDGRIVVAVTGNTLRVVDVSGDAPRVVGSLALEEGSHELFLAGRRAVVLTRSWNFDAVPVPEPAPDERARSLAIAPGSASTLVTAVDLSDPARPDVAATTRFEGEYVTARLVDGVVRLVLRSMPEYRALAESGLESEALLPEQIVEGEGGEPTRQPVVACDAVARPAEPSGTGTTTVVTFRVDGSLEVLDSDAVVADAQTIYASRDSLYVATNAWLSAGDASASGGGPTTDLHAFDISSPTTTEYVASGRVRGQLLNQWSLSEHEGHLRVATTDGFAWESPEGPTSESFVTVLRPEGDRLEAVGQVGGLGRGETIYAVRYFGDLAFVVTFRQIDPLYTLDLSDPAAPEVVGELKIPGFSTYLHPVGEGRLLGVGQDADDQGMTRGTQISLFDVSDLTEPRRLDQEVIRGGTSAVEHDHRAFLWWGPTGTAVVPVEVWDHGVAEPAVGDDIAAVPPEPGPPPFVGAAGFRVAGDEIVPAGRLAHPGGGAAIIRALVVGDQIYTLSERGLMASGLSSFDQRAFVEF